MRRMLLGGVFAMAVGGAATAKPPAGPLSEGREPDPVAREYYNGETPPLPAEDADPGREAPALRAPGAWPLLTLSILDSILGGVEMPLGPLPMNRM